MNDHHKQGGATVAAAPIPALAWAERLEALRRRTFALHQRSRWTVEWAIYRWATEQLTSAAIRIDGSEGLSGPAPARWRLLTHIDAETGAHALAVLDGRAPLLAANVVAALLSSEHEAVVAIRDAGVRRWEHPSAPDPALDPAPGDSVEHFINLALGRGPHVFDERGALPLRFATSLAMHERRGLHE